MDNDQNSNGDNDASHDRMLQDKIDAEKQIWPPSIPREANVNRPMKEKPFMFFVGFILFMATLFILICASNAYVDFLWRRSVTQWPVQLGFNFTSFWIFLSFIVYLRLRRRYSEASHGMILGIVLALVLHILDGIYNRMVSNLSI